MGIRYVYETIGNWAEELEELIAVSDDIIPFTQLQVMYDCLGLIEDECPEVLEEEK